MTVRYSLVTGCLLLMGIVSFLAATTWLLFRVTVTAQKDAVDSLATRGITVTAVTEEDWTYNRDGRVVSASDRSLFPTWILADKIVFMNSMPVRPVINGRAMAIHDFTRSIKPMLCDAATGGYVAALFRVKKVVCVRVVFAGGGERMWSNLPGVTDVQCIECEGLDVGLLSKQTTIRTLDLTGSGITDQDIAELASLEKCELLTLCRCNVSDACIPSLGRMKKLQYLDLSETNVSSNGFAELRRALVDCEIKQE